MAQPASTRVRNICVQVTAHAKDTGQHGSGVLYLDFPFSITMREEPLELPYHLPMTYEQTAKDNACTTALVSAFSQLRPRQVGLEIAHRQLLTSRSIGLLSGKPAPRLTTGELLQLVETAIRSTKNKPVVFMHNGTKLNPQRLVGYDLTHR